jgi:hypothetical protein
MSFAKVSAITMGVVAAFAVGVWTSPQLLEQARWGEWRVRAAAEETAVPSVSVAVPTTATPIARESAKRTVTTRSAAPTVPVSAPQLHTQLKPLLMSGSNMAIAADGFATAAQFAEVAHAARNTGVPFVLLKDRVVNQKKSLATAIRELKPELNSAEEVARARTQAREDLQALGTS